MFTIRLMIFLLILIFGGIGFLNSYIDDNVVRLSEMFLFIEKSVYFVEKSGDEFLFRAHFYNRLPVSGKERYIIYFIDPLTFAATVLRDQPFHAIIGYGIIEEMLTVLKDGVLLLRISIFPKSRYAFDSMFALTIVNVTESYPYTVKELEHAILMSKSLPYFQPFRIIGGVKSFLNFPNSSTTYLESNRIIFPRDGLDLKSIKIYKNYRDGLMENYNYRIILYNYLPLNKGRNGSVFDVSAYNFNKRTKNNILKQFNVFLFMRYQDNNNLYIQYILDLKKKKFDCFFSENIPKCLYVIMNQKTKELDCYIPKNLQDCLYLVKKRDDWFIPLWGFGRYNLDELDPNKNYFFTVQSMRRNLYKEKGFTALQGYDEGEFALRSFKGTVVWIVFKNGTENIVNFNTWPYDSNGNRIDTSFNNHKFPVILNEIQPTTDYFLQNLPTTLALEEKYMYFRIPVEFKDYILSFIIIKHEIYLPIISLVMIIVLLLVIFLIMSFQKMYKKIKTSRQILDK